ncbi:MAG TPA: kelch repeat-containing protein, partial [Chthoniobacterales bacterium]|nr:kelch repeat-containing protein [Chthoniobacterales bacterium]
MSKARMICWCGKYHKAFVTVFAALASLAIPTLIDASSSKQVAQLAPLVVPRTGHVSTVLADGRVLITGGRDNGGNIVAVSEIFDPTTETSTASAVLTIPRAEHTATLLPDGRVLVAGGTGTTGSLASAEVFDPTKAAAGFRLLSATMSAARSGHTATLLNNGTVLIAGGDADGTAEIFDPATEVFTSTLWNLAVPRTGHTATLFSDDSVLLAGGNTDSMELFTAADQKFTLESRKMSAVRTGHWALELSDTRLLLFEGDTGHTIDAFNPSADTLTLKDSLDTPASSATLLANGKILVLGAVVAGLYDPNAVAPTPAFTAFDEVSIPDSTLLLRTGETATELSRDKKVFIAGGVDAQKLFGVPALFNPAKIWTDKDDYLPDEPVLLYGSGWKANEDVYLYAVDSETEQWTYGSTAHADTNGAFAVEPYFIVQ